MALGQAISHQHVSIPTRHQLHHQCLLSAEGLCLISPWDIGPIPIEHGVFQGDTLSPMIFLIAFNLVVQFANKEKASGFSLRYPVPSSAGLPPVNAHIYVEWNEPLSDEPPGWYRCSVTEYSSTCLTTSCRDLHSFLEQCEAVRIYLSLDHFILRYGGKAAICIPLS